MKIEIWITAILLSLVMLADYIFGIEYCSYSCLSNFDGLFFSLFVILGITLTMMVFLVKISPRIYKKWWKFARIAMPIILVLSALINLKLHHQSHGLFYLDNIFDIPAHILMYSIFIIGSAIQIWRGYRMKM